MIENNAVSNLIIDYIHRVKNSEFLQKKDIWDCIKSINEVAKSILFNEACKKEVLELKQLGELLNKYGSYQNYSIHSYNPVCKIKGNPVLYDALLSGLFQYPLPNPIVKRSFNEYNEEIESDIKTIIKLIPTSIQSTVGQMRCRYYVTPLYAACYNSCIPIEIIELLLKNGASVNETILNNGQNTPILEDLQFEISDNRFIEIEELFSKY